MFTACYSSAPAAVALSAQSASGVAPLPRSETRAHAPVPLPCAAFLLLQLRPKGTTDARVGDHDQELIASLMISMITLAFASNDVMAELLRDYRTALDRYGHILLEEWNTTSKYTPLVSLRLPNA